ncbi:MAG: hypothetical protein II969_04585 [Anaerolineaceae bacterium]|nr:hypothetical protein [Anaerolineaceae bacterium]
MNQPHIEIKTTGARSQVFFNGEKVPGVSTIEFEHKPGTVPILKLSFPALDLTWDMLGIKPELPEILGFYYQSRSESSSE